MASLLFLAACGGSNEEKIYNHLEDAVDIENEFSEEENSIAELEEDEQKLYEKIIDLTMDDFDKIKETSEQALTNIEERHELIDLESESLEKSKDEFTKTKDLIEKLEDEKVKEKAGNMYETMNDRYKAYDDLHESYITVLKNEKELYNKFQDKDAEQDAVSDNLDKLNESYQEVIQANDLFNEKTKDYNELKKEFYKQADLNVDFEGAEQNNKEKK